MMKRWFTVHDVKNKRMGLADVNYFGNSTQFVAPPEPTYKTTTAIITTTTRTTTTANDAEPTEPTDPTETGSSTTASASPTDDHFLPLDPIGSDAKSKHDFHFMFLTFLLATLII
jgi:hypothetical protein